MTPQTNPLTGADLDRLQQLADAAPKWNEHDKCVHDGNGKFGCLMHAISVCKFNGEDADPPYSHTFICDILPPYLDDAEIDEACRPPQAGQDLRNSRRVTLLDFIAAANPATVHHLIAQLRQAQFRIQLYEFKLDMLGLDAQEVAEQVSKIIGITAAAPQATEPHAGEEG